jgi:hypothetical protein
MPNPLSRGHLHLSFPTHPPPALHSSLSLFRPSNFPLGVIGVASCSQNDSLSSILAQFNASISELFPSSSPFPLASNCFAFEEGDGNTNLNIGNELPGLVVIPSMMGNKKLYVGTLLADLCSNILGEFSNLVSDGVGYMAPKNNGFAGRNTGKPPRERVSQLDPLPKYASTFRLAAITRCGRQPTGFAPAVTLKEQPA